MKLRKRRSLLWLLASLAALALLALLVAGRPGQPPTPPPTARPASTAVAALSPPVAPSPTRVRPSPTPSPTGGRPLAPTPGSTVAPDLAQAFVTVQPDQFLGQIAARYGVAIDDIVQFSDLENPDLLAAGQTLIIPHRTQRYTPARSLLPDSELVYGPAYLGFDVAEFVAAHPGPLASFHMPTADGGQWGGADVVERVARRFSVGPRALLALLEARGGWLSDEAPGDIARDYPAGHLMGAPGLLPQLEWAANELNRGFYGWLDRGETAIPFQDGVLARGHPGLNPATVAVQRVLAADSSWPSIEAELAAFAAAYQRLFGDPQARDAGPVRPAGLTQPALQLPWAAGQWWYLTGGPHGGWGDGSSWAALDFVPEQAVLGACTPAEDWALAAAAGVVAGSDGGEVLLDLDGDGDVRTGWVLQYLHVSERPPAGASLAAGDPIGRPSCEGGVAQSAHLHIGRRYNGLWVAASGPTPFVLEGWQAFGRFPYEGGLAKAGAVTRQACDCRERARNGLLRAESSGS